MRVLRSLLDADGRTFTADRVWRIDSIGVDIATMSATLRLWSRDGEDTMHLDLRAAEGPRLGRMREWFEVIEPPADAPVEPDTSKPATLSPLAMALRLDDLYTAAARLRDLAAKPEHRGEGLRDLAERLEAAARELARVDRDRAEWLYDKAIDAWYGWGSMATSGGDGMYRSTFIEEARKRRASLLAGRA